ncbi:hypothetical protein M501DRAFT_963774 [Patellaria atrata CBS 101060]|uniref:Uncharacterized protein n=1 Tax=Patellaria atrata CBS 101060 TaxID=1346257 RepID=A0A9P4VKQ1_9PEZI|nr:hypothetical protein M501DRAFT_963774 [Patellaria atrata CBS 101060]
MDAILHQKAKALRPNQFLKPSRYWLAVLFHDKNPDDVSAESDFLWLKGTHKITVETIYEHYRQRFRVDVVLKVNGQVPPTETTMGQLNFYDDNFVIFRAIEASSPEALPDQAQTARTPLQLSNAHVTNRLPQNGISMPPSAPYIKPDPTQPQSTELHRGTATPVSQGSQGYPQSTPGISPSVRPQPQDENLYPTTTHTNTFHESPYPRDTANSTSTGTSHPVVPTSIEPTLAPEYESDGESRPMRQELAAQKDPFADNETFEEDNIADSQAEASTEHFEQVLREQTPEMLELSVAKALKFLDKLQVPLQAHATAPDAAQWLKSIELLRQQAVKTRTVVGVVGNTGAGKSSVINAMLDEERLVPTNCMRACTAVVTEMSWNDSEDERKKYVADIEFIKEDDWRRELKVLFDEIFDGSGSVSKEVSNPDSEAGIAYAKIKAVYPNKTKDMLAESSVEALMRERSVRAVLDTTINLHDSLPTRFYHKLQRYVDSKEKVNKEKDKLKLMEYWPLIKVVKIYTKSPALSTGAVVVDLPGVHDSNAARAAVAAGYMKQCTGLWIVAPINRAVDDKAAKTLLGDTFKRQLKFDGTYSAVTFICSKTDDISITEAAEGLDIDERISAFQADIERIQREKQESKDRMEALVQEMLVYKDAFDECDRLQDIWEDLRSDLAAGNVVYAPVEKTKKRRRSGNGGKRKKPTYDSQVSMIDSGSDEEANESANEDEDEEIEQERVNPLTEVDIDKKLEEVKANKKLARREKNVYDDRIKEAKIAMKQLDTQIADIKSGMSAICIAGRNTYSRTAIQKDFAAGIRELDKAEEEDDDENFNPDEDVRDYEEVARSLPVFCVSSKAYQKLCGRLTKDSGVLGFKTKEATEIPQLQQHCKKLTEAGRAANCRKFLNSLSQLVNSLILWSKNDGTGLKLSADQRQSEQAFLQKRLKDLEKGLESAVEDCMSDVKDTLAENIFDKYKPSVTKAEELAQATAAKWGAHRNEGGLLWATYKATVRRNGVFAGAAGPRDFNLDLADPITKHLANGWEKAFQRRMPNVLQCYVKNSNALLSSFHKHIASRALQRGTSHAGLIMLERQLSAYGQTFQEISAQALETISAIQREANRLFVPIVTAAMEPAYLYCSAESGTGCFKRMKEHMINHVGHYRHQMFRAAVDGVRKELVQMCRTVEEHLANSADRVFMDMRRDYLQVIGGAHLPEGEEMPKWERNLRADVGKVIQRGNESFRRLLAGEPDPEEEEQETAAAEDPMEDDTEDNTNGVYEVAVPHPGTGATPGATVEPKDEEDVDVTAGVEHANTSGNTLLYSTPEPHAEVSEDEVYPSHVDGQSSASEANGDDSSHMHGGEHISAAASSSAYQGAETPTESVNGEEPQSDQLDDVDMEDADAHDHDDFVSNASETPQDELQFQY